jgi:CubicO group peptidase (beta-lactamase class C family)
MIMGFLTSCSAEKTMEQKFEDIDNIFADYNSPDMPGAAVMIISEGKPILQKGYGVANFAESLPVTSKTNFRLASVTKQFTSMSILQLIAKGELSLETTLIDTFPDFPEYGKNITIKHLLQHTSGLQDYEGLEDKDRVAQLKDKDVLQTMKDVDHGYFIPGDEHRYSNSGYGVLTQIIEKITGMPFREYLQVNIFTPLGMTDTLAYENGINEVPNRAYGYTIEEDGVTLTDQSLYSAVLGDGGIYSNLEDLYKWDQALYSDKLIDSRYLDMAFTNGTTNDGSFIDYGFGWRIEKYKDLDIIYHTGSSIGFRNILYRIPSKNFTIVILTNRDSGGEFSTLELVHNVVDLYFN